MRDRDPSDRSGEHRRREQRRDSAPGGLSSGLLRSASTLRSNVRAQPSPPQPGGGGDDGSERSIGWHADPFGRFQQRWWDGNTWTEKTRSADVAAIDPPGIDVAPAHITETTPARPIDDALLPISRRRIADKLALLAGCLVFLGLIAVLVVALTT